MAGELAGKTAIVTGSSRGIGRATAVTLAGLGANVVLCGRDAAALEAAAALVRATGAKAAINHGNLGDPAVPQAITDLAMGEFGRIDIIVANAGATRQGTILDFGEQDWKDAFAVKFFGHVRLARAAWPQLKANHGSWVSVSGVATKTPRASFVIGVSVNNALIAFTKALADLGLTDHVQVNTVNPGNVDTDRFKRRLEVLMKEHGTDEAGARRIWAERGGHTAQPEELAGFIAYVVTRRGRYFHGATLDMDAGTYPGL